MAEGQAHHHRSTLKQQNKKFKSKHATKKSIRNAAKGRIASPSSKTSFSLSSSAQLRLNRRNTAKQAQTNKRLSLASGTQIFSGVNGAPRIVAVIPLTQDVCARRVVISLAESLQMSADDCPDIGVWRMSVERFRTSLQFINVPYKNFYAALDACKIADYVVFVLSTTVEVDPWGDTLLRTLQAQGLPDVVSVVPQDSVVDAKTRSGVLKSLLSFMRYFVPSQSRIFDLYASPDRLNALRALAEGKPGDVRWREGRTWILGESVSWEGGTLKVTGTVRGSSLSANRLVHLPNYGDFQVCKIESAPLPRVSKSGITMEMDSVVLLAEPEPSEVDSLVSSNDPDDLLNEQTWPTEEEMNQHYDNPEQTSLPDATKGTKIKRVPKGTSEYQAAWIIDQSDEEGDDVEPGGEEEEANASDGSVEEEMEVIMEDKETEIENPRSVDHEDLDAEEEEKQLQRWKDRRREEETDHAFPDEIDTPRDQFARVRFQRYRGLQSFRTSPWDPFENLPRDYARIFQFEDFKRTENKIRKRAEADTSVVEPGTRVSVYLKDVPQEVPASGPMILFGLLQHEHKITVLNFAVQRNTEYDESVRSKDPVVLCVGPRRMRVNPIYSQLTHGGGKGSNNVHKFERYLRHGVTNVATVYGPVTLGKQPCILLRETADIQAPHLVATGSFSNPDTTRIIAKRINLTGHPFKVHKKSATIRYMFFNSEDVNYFKPIQLHTKYGRIGHIMESLGTHGYFKARFDGPLNQMDTVCMYLYKRVYPRWWQLWKTDNRPALVEDAMEE
ncbi:hypothetical protein M378DRAFT_172293 [Amanita muscaria Koide BX008]|uniref:Bms1-type G domain-containing protein n=1 Tax=Amanita muscaria (strain Koide BX008) TaxID=946122 RepID=A0A0C2WL72_AMAMK|nr:hypothetical protein M378DRAFT_172293 [Amanita muscaria Koide BX008]